ncbi:rhodopsin-like [Penaeus japonicus]|uniref:rhodopsin-like n=1 Tax=Penaeus japonicus TaxID=27405 RepID=UPI001C70C186|nr:rhodopsin-like [Penaeus japonicus]
MSTWNQPPQDTVLPTTNPYGNYTVVDTVPESMLHMIHSHWYQFPPMNPLWYGLLGFWMTVMGTLSVAGNFVVIWVFMNTKSLRSPANLLVVNLAISDFFMMLTMTPPLLVNAYWGTWILGALFCEVYAFLGSFFGCVSIWTMVFITAIMCFRCLCICIKLWATFRQISGVFRMILKENCHCHSLWPFTHIGPGVGTSSLAAGNF